MNTRDQVLSILNHRQPDMVPWLGDLDYWIQYLNAAAVMPEKYRAKDGIYRLHRDLGVGFYLQSFYPFRPLYDGVEIIEEPVGRGKVTRVITPHGELREFQRWVDESYCIAWSERFVKSWRDLKALRYLFEHTFYEADYEMAQRRYDLIGDDGVVLCYLPRSPLMEMVAILAGIQNVTFMQLDAPEEFEETFALIGRKHNEASQLAVDSPAECLMIPENLSSEVVGKRLFNQYVRPHDEFWTQQIRAAGKFSFIHIDGTLRGLIREASETGFTVLEAVTPAPVGDIAIEELHEWVAEETILWGGIPGVYFTDLISDEEFDRFVIRVLEVMKTEPRYVLGVADQVPPLARFERIARVRPLVEKYGQYEKKGSGVFSDSLIRASARSDKRLPTPFSRVKRAIRFERPDRAPISHAVLPAAQLKYGQALAEILTEYREDFGWDYLDDLPLEDFPALYREGRQRDAFGTVWHVEQMGICGIPVECPIADLDRYDEYQWPADFPAGPPAARQYSGHMSGHDDRWYARGAWITYFEQLQQLRGMENLLMDVALESAEFNRLADDLLAFNLRWIDKWVAMPYEGLHFADDWGDQQRLMIRPELWQKIFKPRYAEMFRRVKDAGMHVWFHSDGRINDIIDDLIEIGVDVINSQTKVVGLDWIAQNVRGRVAFRTDIDRQQVMPFGSTSEVKEEVDRTFEACGTPDGGIIACGEVGPDVPLENIRAMYEAFREYGQYQ